MQPQHRKQDILRAASRLFARKGYHATNVSDIIRAAEIARGTFYLYFKGKRAIFEELLESLLDRIRASISRVDLDSDLTVYRQMERNVQGVVDALLDDRHLTRILLRGAVGEDPGFDRKVACFYDAILDVIRASFELGLKMGIVRPLDPRLASACALGSIKEVMTQIISRRERVPSGKVATEILRFAALGVLDQKFRDTWGPSVG